LVCYITHFDIWESRVQRASNPGGTGGKSQGVGVDTRKNRSLPVTKIIASEGLSWEKECREGVREKRGRPGEKNRWAGRDP